MDKQSKIVWPHGKKFAACLTHDVDRIEKSFQYFTRFIRFSLRFQFIKGINEIKNLANLFIQIEKNPYWGFERLIEIEKKHNVKSTFFFLSESGKIEVRHPSTWKLYLGRYDVKKPEIIKIIRKLDLEGWEIGLHGSYKSYVNKNLLAKEKNDLEFILGKKIYGVRQHYLNLEIPNTWIFQKELGIKYDSTFSFHNQSEPEKNHYFPFFPSDDSTFMEIPLILMDSYLISHHKDQNSVWSECKKKIEFAEKIGGVITINWHQERSNNKEFPNNLSNYEDIIKLCLKKNAWVTNAYEIYKWIISNKKISDNGD